MRGASTQSDCMVNMCGGQADHTTERWVCAGAEQILSVDETVRNPRSEQPDGQAMAGAMAGRGGGRGRGRGRGMRR